MQEREKIMKLLMIISYYNFIVTRPEAVDLFYNYIIVVATNTQACHMIHA